MRRLVSIAVFLSVFAFVPLAAQDDGPNMFFTQYYKTLSGQNALFDRYAQEYGFPYYDELVRQGVIVSYTITRVRIPNSEYSHVVTRKYENWDAVNTSVNAAEVCQTVFGMTCTEKRAEIGIDRVATVRRLVRTEVSASLRP